ncbi:connectin isoform X2 [Bombus terrestris]|uniref:Connectin isoform X2 n=1 Tax=Bombus terrestris TaxID=30195 RepID=A0A9B0F5Z0_BOMTE|nr:connectin isoform X2 [Bombus terrestris]
MKLSWIFHHLLILTMMFPTSLAASTRIRSRKKPVKETKEVNICAIRGVQAPMYCYCDNNAIRNATEATCVVLSRFSINDPTWNYFVSQIFLQKLKIVVRTPNGLEYIPVQLLKQLKNLQKITLQDANIDELKESAFSNLPTITEIDLSANSISTLRTHAFENMKNLIVIFLNSNRITEINRETFINLPSIKMLCLNENNISTLHDKAFKHLTTLEELQLVDNQIKVITADSFHGLKSLLKLDMRNNLIAMIGDRTFIELVSLKQLDLDQNEIEFISEKALDGMVNLQKLQLCDNKLVTLEPNFLAGATGIYTLDLRDNLLMTFTFENVKPILTNLYNTTSFFYLSGNKLMCDCKLVWMWGLRNQTKNVKLRESLEKLTCLLETNNATMKVTNSHREWNAALKIARKSEDGSIEDYDAYLGDEYESKDGYEDSDSQPEMQTVDGKLYYVKNLFDLKVEELPCPKEKSKKDGKGNKTDSVWRSSSSDLICFDLLLFSLLLFLPVLFN